MRSSFIRCLCRETSADGDGTTCIFNVVGTLPLTLVYKERKKASVFHYSSSCVPRRLTSALCLCNSGLAASHYCVVIGSTHPKLTCLLVSGVGKVNLSSCTGA